MMPKSQGLYVVATSRTCCSPRCNKRLVVNPLSSTLFGLFSTKWHAELLVLCGIEDDLVSAWKRCIYQQQAKQARSHCRHHARLTKLDLATFTAITPPPCGVRNQPRVLSLQHDPASFVSFALELAWTDHRLQ